MRLSSSQVRHDFFQRVSNGLQGNAYDFWNQRGRFTQTLNFQAILRYLHSFLLSHYDEKRKQGKKNKERGNEIKKYGELRNKANTLQSRAVVMTTRPKD